MPRRLQNDCRFTGRLTANPELRYTTNDNTPVCSFTIAVDRRWGGKRDQNADQKNPADFLPIVTWNKTAEFCSKYFTKGMKVMVGGEARTRFWEDNDGKKHYVTEFHCDEVDFAESKKGAPAAPDDDDGLPV